MDKVGGEEGEGEMYGESNIEIYNTMCKTDSQWEFAVWLRELKKELCSNIESGVGWEGRWERGSRVRIHMYTYGWFMLMFGRNQQILQSNYPSLKNKLFKKKKHAR